MFGSFLPSLWSSSNQSLLGSREPTLLCNQVPYQDFKCPVTALLSLNATRQGVCRSQSCMGLATPNSSYSLRKLLFSGHQAKMKEIRPWPCTAGLFDLHRDDSANQGSANRR